MASDAMGRDDVSDWSEIHGEQQWTGWTLIIIIIIITITIIKLGYLLGCHGYGNFRGDSREHGYGIMLY